MDLIGEVGKALERERQTRKAEGDNAEPHLHHAWPHGRVCTSERCPDWLPRAAPDGGCGGEFMGKPCRCPTVDNASDTEIEL